MPITIAVGVEQLHKNRPVATLQYQNGESYAAAFSKTYGLKLAPQSSSVHMNISRSLATRFHSFSCRHSSIAAGMLAMRAAPAGFVHFVPCLPTRTGRHGRLGRDGTLGAFGHFGEIASRSTPRRSEVRDGVPLVPRSPFAAMVETVISVETVDSRFLEAFSQSLTRERSASENGRPTSRLPECVPRPQTR